MRCVLTCLILGLATATAEIPVIFMTAKSQGFERDLGLSFGAIGYIIKPFDALALGTRVRELLG